MPCIVTSPDMDQWYQRLTALLTGAVGRERAMTIERLQEAAGIPSRRTTEAMLESCLDRFPFAVVAGACGYYRPTEAADLNRYLENLRSRHVALAIRERTVRRKALADGWQREHNVFVCPPRQMSLWGREAVHS